jgi:hypothetical protein
VRCGQRRDEVAELLLLPGEAGGGLQLRVEAMLSECIYWKEFREKGADAGARDARGSTLGNWES